MVAAILVEATSREKTQRFGWDNMLARKEGNGFSHFKVSSPYRGFHTGRL